MTIEAERRTLQIGAVPDRQRRALLSGLGAGVASIFLAAACRPSGQEAVQGEQPAAPVRQPDLGVSDPSIPPGASAMAEEELAWAGQFLARNPSIDLHCHPGMFFFQGMTPEDPAVREMSAAGVFAERAVADMAAGQLSVGLFATVADLTLIGANEKGLYARREFKPGEAYADHQRQLAILQAMVDSGWVAPVRSVADIEAARRSGIVGAIFACEGGDFLEGRPERVAEAWQSGVRSIQLVHYHINALGDIQTESPRHGGLTAAGRAVVDAMNRLGMLVDMAHATFATTRDAAEISTQPIMVSHSYVSDGTVQHPRLLSEGHALLVAATGGLIGAWPTGIGNPDFPSYIDRLFRLVDLVGIDHVGLGTDMDANFRPVWNNYRQLPQLPVALKRGGMSDEEIAKVLGGNFLRVFDLVTRGAESAS